MLPKIIKFCKDNEKDLILAAAVILVALISFGLGRLSKIRELKTPIKIDPPAGGFVSVATTTSATTTATATAAEGGVVASKNGTKYHYPWCPGAATIKEENKIYFATIEDARKAGYTPASNCKGLK